MPSGIKRPVNRYTASLFTPIQPIFLSTFALFLITFSLLLLLPVFMFNRFIE